MNGMTLGSLGGDHSMEKEVIFVSSASWRFVVAWISYQTLRKRLLPIKSIKMNHNQGDIFMLQLRGHIDVA